MSTFKHQAQHQESDTGPQMIHLGQSHTFKDGKTPIDQGNDR